MWKGKTGITTYSLFIIGLISITCFGQRTEAATKKAYSVDPARFEESIQRFEAADGEQPPPMGAIVCIGSSSIRGWHETIQSDLAPLTIIPRGFGGSNMNDALHYADRIVLPYRPRAIVLYEGDNDIAQGIKPKTIADTFRLFVEKIQDELPECRIYFLSIKPSIKRWHLWPKMKKANRLIAAACSEDKQLTYVDVASTMLDDEGNPRVEIFQEDDLHMTRAGYILWQSALKPILIDAELQYELR